MTWFDHKTSELYDLVLYQDAETVVFWTVGRESVISADAFAERYTLPTPDDMPDAAPITVDRFVSLTPDVWPASLLPRRQQLADYAARNGGQIARHIEAQPPPAGGVQRLAQHLKDFFRPT